MLIPLGFLAAAGGQFGASFEHIQTTIVSGLAPGAPGVGVTFTGLNAYSPTYKHLQVRAVLRSDNYNSGVDYLRTWFNGVKSNGNYRSHFLAGNGSTVYSNYFGETNVLGLQPGSQSDTNTTGSYGAVIIDILDAYNTNKNTTIRAFMGQNGANRHVGIASGVFLQTAAINTFEIGSWFGNGFLNGSRVSIYGVK